MSARPIARIVEDAQAHMDAHRWASCRALLEELFRRNHRPDLTAMHLGDVCFADGDASASFTWHRQALLLNKGLSQALEHMIFVADAQPQTTDDEALRLRQEWWTRFGAQCYAQRQPHRNTRDPHRPLRVGYVSGDFKRHSAAFAFAAIITGHSDQVVPYFYSTLERDKGDGLTDQWRQAYGARFRDVAALAPLALAHMIQHDQIDILVDLSGFTGNNRLLTFAARPAPVQIQAWGYTLGAAGRTVDVVFSDAVVASPAVRARLPERIFDLPSVISYFPLPDLPPPTPLPCLTQPPTFAVFQRATKVNSETLTTWRALLERLPDARLRFQGFDYTPLVQMRIREGLGATADRVSFHVEQTDRDHKLSYQPIDLALDTWPQTGGMSTLDALWMHVPTVTLLGERMIQRTSASFLTVLGLTDFIAYDQAQYIDLAIQWVMERRAELVEIRAGVREALQRSPIIVGYGDAVEAAYRSLWMEWCHQGEIRKVA